MTRITLEDARAVGYPVVKRTALGQLFNGAILKAESRDRMKRSDDGTMVPIIKTNGKHAQEMVVTCLTLPGTTAPAGLGEDESIPEPGAIVRLILKGKTFGDWIDAKKNLPGGTVAVGDVVTTLTEVAQIYDAQGNASGGEITDQKAIDAARIKGKSVGIYGPLTLAEPEDSSEWTDKAVAAYRSLQERPTAENVVTDHSQPATQVAAEAAAAAPKEPARPKDLSQAAWDQMPLATKIKVAETMGDDEPPY